MAPQGLYSVDTYLKSGGKTCPYCFEEGYLSRSTEFCTKIYANKIVVFCGNCESEWYDVYTHTGIKEIYDGTNTNRKPGQGGRG